MTCWACAVCGSPLEYPLVKLFDEVAGKCDTCGGSRRMVKTGCDE